MQDWELQDLLNLLERLGSFLINGQGQDRLIWGDKEDGKYSVRAGYLSLCAQNEMVVNWLWKFIRRTKLPLKLIRLSWVALYEACLTQDNLSRRNFHIVKRCYMCQQAIETNRHLFYTVQQLQTYGTYSYQFLVSNGLCLTV